MFGCYALHSAVRRIDVNKLSRLKQKMEQNQKMKNLEKKLFTYHKNDTELHLLLVSSAKYNKRFQILFSHIYNVFRVSQSIGLDWDKGSSEHITLIDALLERNEDKGLKALEFHLNNAQERGMRALERKLFDSQKKGLPADLVRMEI